jgi:hypothetical protein
MVSMINVRTPEVNYPNLPLVYDAQVEHSGSIKENKTGIKNLETELKLLNLKLAQQRRDTSGGDENGAGMSEDQMDAIFRAIAASQDDLRKECQKEFCPNTALVEHNLDN